MPIDLANTFAVATKATRIALIDKQTLIAPAAPFDNGAQLTIEIFQMVSTLRDR